MRVRWTNTASISIQVVSYQADLRSRVSVKTPWRIDVRGSGAGHVQWSRSPPRTVGRAPGLGDANLDGPGGRRRLASSERDVQLRGEGE